MVPASKSCPVFYLGASTGINNSAGLFGINADLPISAKVSIGAGVGASFWGNKTFLDATYYFRQCHRGWAVGAGVTRNSGMTDTRRKLHTTTGTETVTLDLKPKTNVFIAGYRFWSTGKRGNRIYLMLGWSAGVTNTKYVVRSGQQLTNDQRNRIDAFSPGGLVIGAGFNFAFNSRKNN
ncbi:MAG: hypothetical protein H0X33_06310 [Taibaiella sp.]|nr:hypothetical protein [Taibaiella sp.]